MGEDADSAGRKPPRDRRRRIGRSKEPVLGSRAKAERKRQPEDKAKPERKPKPPRKPKPERTAASRERERARRAESEPRKERPTPKERPPRRKRRDPKPATFTEPATETRRDVISRRISAVVILLIITVVIMAWTDAPPFFDDVTEEQRVEETVERFFDAYGAQDFETVCGLFSPEVVAAIEQAGATETREGQLEGCIEILEARFSGADAEATKLEVKVESVRVSGPRAVAEVIVKSEESPKGRPLPVELEMGPDGWLVTRQVITG